MKTYKQAIELAVETEVVFGSHRSDYPTLECRDALLSLLSRLYDINREQVKRDYKVAIHQRCEANRAKNLKNKP